mmetsp:Transcript_2379/g.8950  ORF Transcript_2379/g.8950 Transcript_2379/m.8950 type:complete len:109 (-) Transcript_2379:2070-2396(-)
MQSTQEAEQQHEEQHTTMAHNSTGGTTNSSSIASQDNNTDPAENSPPSTSQKLVHIPPDQVATLQKELSLLSEPQLQFKIQEIVACSNALNVREEQVLNRLGRRWKTF